MNNYSKKRSLSVERGGGGGGEREEENGLAVGRKRVREIPRIFELSLSLSPSFPLPSSLSLNYPQGSLYIPWEIGLNGVDRNRFSKINAFRRRAVSNDRDKRNEAIGHDIQMRIQSIKNRSLRRMELHTFSASIQCDFELLL